MSLIFYFYFYLLDYLPTSNKGIVQNKVVQFNGVHVPSVARLDNDKIKSTSPYLAVVPTPPINGGSPKAGESHACACM